MMQKTLLLLSLVVVVRASCPNACSGHGTCNSYDQCTCFTEQNKEGYTNTEFDWTGADCSLRKCARGVSWANVKDACTHLPDRECSDRGKCDRATGLCTCFPGFEGSSCQRTRCPNDCSGHGTCRSNKDFAYDFSIVKAQQMGAPQGEYFATYLATYENAWDSGKSYGCKCDMGYRGADCSQIECPSRQDPLDGECPHGATIGKVPSGSGFRTATQAEIKNFQNQYSIAVGNTAWKDAFENAALNDKVVDSKVFSCYGSMAGQDCSGRGLCNYKTGSCQCFTGYSGTACEIISEFS